MPKTASSIVQKLQKSSIRHTVSLPGSGPYTTSLASYWSKQEQELQPLCIIQPHSVLELAKAISLLTKSNTRFAIRGGGHQAWPGSANLEGGVTLDLRGLHEIEMVNGGNGGNEVRVGPGVWWGALYEFLSERRLTVPGGRALEPGVVGLMLGGGLSYFSPKTGFACDSATSFTVVTYTGSIIIASPSSHPSLFQCLKGSGNALGVVASVTLSTMRDIDIWGGLLMYEYDQTDGILTEFAQLLEPVDRRAQVTGGTTDAQGKGAMSKHVMMTVSIGYAQQWNAKGAMASLKYTKPVTKSPRVFNGFKTLPTAGGEIRKMGLGQLMTEEGQFNGGELRRLFTTTTFQCTLPMLQHSAAAWETSITSLKCVRNLVTKIFYDPVPPSTILASNARGGNALGLSRYPATSSRALVIATISMFWEDAADDEVVVRVAEETIKEIEKSAHERGVYYAYKFMNYAWRSQGVERADDEVNALVDSVSREYDPERVAERLVGGCWGLGG